MYTYMFSLFDTCIIIDLSVHSTKPTWLDFGLDGSKSKKFIELNGPHEKKLLG